MYKKNVCFAAAFLLEEFLPVLRFLVRFPLSLQLWPRPRILAGRRRLSTFRTLLPTRPASLGVYAYLSWYVSFELFPRFLPSCTLLFRRQTKSGASLTSSPRNSAWLGSTRHVFFFITQYSVVPFLTASSGQEHDPMTISARAPEPGILPTPAFFQPVLAHPSGLIFVLFILPRPSDFHAGFASPVTPMVLPSAPASAGEGRLLNSNHLFDPSIFSDLTGLYSPPCSPFTPPGTPPGTPAGEGRFSFEFPPPLRSTFVDSWRLLQSKLQSVWIIFSAWTGPPVASSSASSASRPSPPGALKLTCQNLCCIFFKLW